MRVFLMSHDLPCTSSTLSVPCSFVLDLERRQLKSAIFSLGEPMCLLKRHPSPWHPYIQRVWHVWVEVPSQAPSPRSCFSPDSTPEKARQMMTPSPKMLKTTPTGYLNCPPENKLMVFWSSFPISSLRAWKAKQKRWYPLNLGLF